MSQDPRPLGPLTPYVGVWNGKGLDTVPDGKGGKTVTPFLQQVTFEKVPALSYGKQTVHALRYHCNDFVIAEGSKPRKKVSVYEEGGYFLWLPDDGTVVLQVSNPRGLSMLAAGAPEKDDAFQVTTLGGDGGRGILVTTYLPTIENVVAYEASLSLPTPDTFRYVSDTHLRLADGSIFHQTDVTTLRRS